jgi:hypothetical protein
MRFVAGLLILTIPGLWVPSAASAQAVPQEFIAALHDSLHTPASCGVSTFSGYIPGISVNEYYRRTTASGLTLAYSGGQTSRFENGYGVDLQKLCFEKAGAKGALAAALGYGYVSRQEQETEEYRPSGYRDYYNWQDIAFVNSHNALLNVDGLVKMSPSSELLLGVQDNFTVRTGFRYYENLDVGRLSESSLNVSYEDHHHNSYANTAVVSAGILVHQDWPGHTPFLLYCARVSSGIDNIRLDTLAHISTMFPFPQPASTVMTFSGHRVVDNSLSLEVTFGDFFPEKTYSQATFRGGWLKACGILEYVGFGYRLNRFDHSYYHLEYRPAVDTNTWSYEKTIDKGFDNVFYYVNSARLYVFKHFYVSCAMDAEFHSHRQMRSFLVTRSPVGFGLTFVRNHKIVFNVKSGLFTFESDFQYGGLSASDNISLGLDILALY